MTHISTIIQIAWPLITNFSCDPTAPTCARADNMGWRYLLFILGSITLALWALRFVSFTLLESPRYLAGLGRDKEAVEVIRKLAAYNSTDSDVSVESLKEAGRGRDEAREGEGSKLISESSNFGLEHVKALFATRKMAWSTSLLIALWGTSSSRLCLRRFSPYFANW